MTTTEYYGGAEEVVTKGTSVKTNEYITAGPVLLEKTGSTFTYIAQDGEASVTEELTSAGTVQGAKLYKPYGMLSYSTGSTPTDLEYTGQVLDSSGLLYYHARYYDRVVGQFTSGDFVQGPNRYAYVGGNPETYTDPTGMDGISWNPGGLWQDLTSAASAAVSWATNTAAPALLDTAITVAAPVVESIAVAFLIYSTYDMFAHPAAAGGGSNDVSTNQGQFTSVASTVVSIPSATAPHPIPSPIPHSPPTTPTSIPGNTPVAPPSIPTTMVNPGTNLALPNWVTNTITSTSELNPDSFAGINYAGIQSGGRSGGQRALNGIPNSYTNSTGGHYFIYDSEGRLIYDASLKRVKMTVWDETPDGNLYPRDVKLKGEVPSWLCRLLESGR